MENLSLADDRLVGVQAIADYRGEKKRRTHYLIERGLLPVGREGKFIIASKRKLRELHELETSGQSA